MSKFHHAYNGIPTKRSDDDLFLKDGQPDPLDHLAPDTYSGTLKLTIETQTPLITAWRDPDGRLVVPSASGEKKGALTDDDAIIPANADLNFATQPITLKGGKRMIFHPGNLDFYE